MTQEVDVDVEVSLSAQALDGTLLRQAFGAFATGVTVVTAGVGRAPHGMTANAFTSLSLDPPLVLLCIGREALMHNRLLAEGTFGVSVLACDQESIAAHFADRRRAGPTQFDGIDTRPGPVAAVPLIAGAVAGFECELEQVYDGGDHSIVTGRLLSVHCESPSPALLFFRGRFRQLHTELSEVAS